MLEQLKFVKGAVSTKDFVPALSHFHIAAGRITGFNGNMAISAPIAIDLDCCPKGDAFIKAVQACGSTVQLHLTPAGKLAVRSGKFRAFVECVDAQSWPMVQPEGTAVELAGDLLPALRLLLPFIGEDASRPWAHGVLLNGNFAYATNNVILAQHWLPSYFPFKVCVPRYAVQELVRIGEEPTRMELTATSATVHYDGNRWLRTNLVNNDWPDVDHMLSKAIPDADTAPVPDELWEALATLKPFLDAYLRVYCTERALTTALEDGASVEFNWPHGMACFNHAMFSKLEGVAKRANFERYPLPVPWFADNVRGLFMGMRADYGQA